MPLSNPKILDEVEPDVHKALRGALPWALQRVAQQNSTPSISLNLVNRQDLELCPDLLAFIRENHHIHAATDVALVVCERCSSEIEFLLDTYAQQDVAVILLCDEVEGAGYHQLPASVIANVNNDEAAVVQLSRVLQHLQSNRQVRIAMDVHQNSLLVSLLKNQGFSVGTGSSAGTDASLHMHGHPDLLILHADAIRQGNVDLPHTCTPLNLGIQQMDESAGFDLSLIHI